MIRKAVIPVAGLGTRFLPATKAQPKEMLPIVDKPVIQYIVEEVVSAGIDQIVFVTGRHKRAIEDHFDKSPELEHTLRARGKEHLLNLVKGLSELASIIYVRQKEPLGLGHAVLTAEPAVGNEPFAVLLGDDIIASQKPAIAQLIEVFEEYRHPVLGVQEVPPEEVEKYGIVDAERLSGDVYRVRDLVEKPSPEDAPSNLAIAGRYILTPAVFEALKKLKPGRDGEIQLTDAIRTVALERPVYAKIIKGRRYDTGSKAGFLEATVDFALSREDLREDFIRLLKEKLREELNG